MLQRFGEWDFEQWDKVSIPNRDLSMLQPDTAIADSYDNQCFNP